MRYTDSLIEERNALANQIMAMADKAATEERSLTDSENASIDQMRARVSQLDEELGRWADTTSEFRAFEDIHKKIATVREDRKPSEPVREFRSAGQQFTGTDEFRSYDGRGRSAAVPVSGLLETRAVLGTADLGMGRSNQFVVENPRYESPLLNSIGYVPISENSVDVIKWSFTNAAAKVAEKSKKPESAFARTITPVPVPTWAHWVEITRQLARNEATVASLIDTDLRDGLLAALEQEAAAKITSATLPTASGDTLLGAIRAGIGALPVGFTANAVLLNPSDWADLDIAVMGATVNGPVVTQGFWGLSPVSSPLVPSGSAYVGDFRRGVKQFAQDATSVYMTDSDVGESGESNFKRNVLTLLGECASLIEVVDARGLVEVSTV